MTREDYDKVWLGFIVSLIIIAIAGITLPPAVNKVFYHTATRVNATKIDSDRDVNRYGYQYSTTYKDDSGKLYVVEGLKAYESDDNVTLYTNGIRTDVSNEVLYNTTFNKYEHVKDIENYLKGD